MRLKKIEMIGFKSFADRVVLQFDEGITAIVGPNGCGKSNVSDAFRWVMGEQSAKSMRGGKMYDVLFAGTENRKPLNLAEVTITLTDVSDALPVEYEEVSVTRRLHRSGDSEYLLNGQPVRLKDIHSLFLDSGVGKNTFAIFEQGKIEQVINYNPTERRRIFEDAAGILRFLQRKREALKKLEATGGNMDRVGDIHKEVQSQIEVLEKQAEEAKLFKERKVQLEQTEKALYLARFDDFSLQMQEGQKQKEHHMVQIKTLTEKKGSLDQEVEGVKKQIKESETSRRKQEKAIYELKTASEVSSQKKKAAEQRLQEAKKREQESLKEQQRREKEAVFYQEKKNGLQQELEKEQQTLQGKEGTLKEKKAFLQEQELEIQTLRQESASLQAKRLAAVQAEHKTVTEVKECRIRKESVQELLKTRQGDLVDAKQKCKELCLVTCALQKEMNDRVKDLEEKQKKLDGTKELLESAKERKSLLEEELGALVTDSAELAARQKVLLKMRQDFEGLSKGGKTLCQAKELQDIVTPLYQHVAGAAKKEEVKASLGPYTDTLYVEKKEDLDRCLSWAKSHQVLDFSILCGELLGEGDTVVDQLFSDRSTVDVISDLATCFVKGKGCASKDGALLDDRGVLFVFGDQGASTFERESELIKLAASTESAKKKVVDAEKEIEKQEAALQQLQQKVLQSDREQRESEMQTLECRVKLEQAESSQLEQEKKIAHSEKEREEKTAALEKIEKRLQLLSQEQEQVLQQREESEKSVSRIDARLLRKEEEVQVIKSGFEKDSTHYHDAKSVVSSLQKEWEVLQVRQKENDHAVQALSSELVKLKSLQQSIVEEQELRTGDAGEQKKNIQEAVGALKETETLIREKRKILQETEKSVKQTEQSLQKLEKDKDRVSFQQESLEKEKKKQQQALFERYNLSIEGAKGQTAPLEISIQQAEKIVRDLRGKIDSSGDINMTSIEEYEKYRLRNEFLTKQLGDLSESRDEIERHIGDLDHESRKIFGEVFQQIRKNFQKNFQVLFQGGQADLCFTEEKDILESGIDIVAKPPGKQMRSISLLSGGEKCLTAVALLFAIFEVRAAPFCILDEIDAPLDDANIDRFLQVVRQFVDQCQFIIITHNKRTMAIADQIFGVSMQEKGVSKLLSMQFDHETTVAPLDAQEQTVGALS